MSKRVLIVDDMEPMRMLLRMTVEMLGVEVYEADNGEQALELAEQIKPDVMFLDITMPGELDGYQVCQKIKSNRETRSIHVMLLSAHGQKTDIDKGKESGADAYVSKPFSPADLQDQVSKICGLKH